MDSQTQLLDLVREYEMPSAAFELLAAHPPLVIAGMTGSGKDSIAEHIKLMSDWRSVVTHTTRPPRSGEQNGRDYWFVSEAEMKKLIQDHYFIEVKWIHAGQVSGPSIAAYNTVLQDGHEPLLNIDVQGIETLLAKGVDIRPYFILPPSFEDWMERLDKRGHMSHVEKVKRLASAKVEMDIAINNDKYILVVNDQVSRVAEEILQGATDGPSQFERRGLAKKLIESIQAY